MGGGGANSWHRPTGCPILDEVKGGNPNPSNRAITWLTALAPLSPLAGTAIPSSDRLAFSRTLAAQAHHPRPAADRALPRIVAEQRKNLVLKESGTPHPAHLVPSAVRTTQRKTTKLAQRTAGQLEVPFNCSARQGLCPRAQSSPEVSLAIRPAREDSTLQPPQPRARKTGNGAGKRGRAIQRLGPFQANSQIRRVFSESDVHIIENLDVVA